MGILRENPSFQSAFCFSWISTWLKDPRSETWILKPILDLFCGPRLPRALRLPRVPKVWSLYVLIRLGDIAELMLGRRWVLWLCGLLEFIVGIRPCRKEAFWIYSVSPDPHNPAFDNWCQIWPVWIFTRHKQVVSRYLYIARNTGWTCYLGTLSNRKLHTIYFLHAMGLIINSAYFPETEAARTRITYAGL